MNKPTPKHTMKNYTKTLLAAFAVALLSCSVAQAVQITGGISLAGGPVTTNTGQLATATSIVSFGNRYHHAGKRHLCRDPQWDGGANHDWFPVSSNSGSEPGN